MSPSTPPRRRVLVLGATGTIGRATVRALLDRGHDVVCLVRPGWSGTPPGGGEAELRSCDVGEAGSVSRDGFQGEGFDAVVSCMASRTGAPEDAWAVDHDAHLTVLKAAQESGVDQFVLLSALCVQKPRLAFQHAKLAFEEALRNSGLDWSIVRPTAFFKSLSGQVDRVRSGKPFLVFGDGTLTACKPIGAGDLAGFLAECLHDPARRNRILPVGGPGPALTAREQGELLFEAAGMKPRFRQVPVGLLDAVVGALGLLGRVIPPLAAKAELARIGRYYATESMLVWDPETRRYDPDATPEYGVETLGDYYRRMLRGEILDERGDHAVF
ncbi:MAG: NAD(P)H-binding protein [Gemmatimonadota bacterium]